MPSSYRPLRQRLTSVLSLILILSFLPGLSFASAYNGRPKLVVVIVIDQFRGDYLERYRDQFGDAGFRLLLDHGAYFANCNYDYANTRTAPGHSTLFTGAYSNGHGIAANEWWDQKKKRMVTSVEDDAVQLVGVPADQAANRTPSRKAKPAPRLTNLQPATLADDSKLPSQAKPGWSEA